MDLLREKILNKINWFRYIIINSKLKEITRFLNRKNCNFIFYIHQSIYFQRLWHWVMTLQISCHLCIFGLSNLFILTMSRSTLVSSALMIPCKLLFLYLINLTTASSYSCTNIMTNINI